MNEFFSDSTLFERSINDRSFKNFENFESETEEDLNAIFSKNYVLKLCDGKECEANGYEHVTQTHGGTQTKRKEYD